MKKKIQVLVVKRLMVLFLLCAAGLLRGQNDSLCIVQGTVYEKGTRIPLNQFLVRVSETHACLTNAEGFYAITHLPPGTYKITVAKKQDTDLLIYHEFTTAEFTLRPGQDTVIDLYLEPHQPVMIDWPLITLPPWAMLSTGIHQGIHSTGEIAFGWHNVWSSDFFRHKFTTRVLAVEGGTEFNFNRNRFLLGPKIGVHYYGFFGLIKTGADLTWYTDLSKGALYFRPHVGLSLASAIDLDAGWNICLEDTPPVPYIDRFHVSLMINFVTTY